MNPPTLRILDANANRAREALRVMEDAARFALDDQKLCGRIKNLRHGLIETIRPLLPAAILCRDTPGDVGTENKTGSEGRRTGLEQVVTAAGKRLGEALRVIEECLKIGPSPQPSPGVPGEGAEGSWRNIERIRYQVYEIEMQLALRLGRGQKMAGVRLCVLLTEKLCRGPWLKTAEEAIGGGATCIQLREKEMDGRELLRHARELVKLCRDTGTICIINDRPDIAILSGADGVHLGQQDLPCREVRKIVGNETIVGVSTHNIGQARAAVADGADYIGVGPIFPSSTKPRDFVAGLEYARQVAAEIRLPALAIAGITLSNVGQVTAAGLSAIAVCSAVIGAADVRQAAAEFLRILNEPRP